MEFLQNNDFREFVELLNKHAVRFLLVGGYAVGFYGHPRYTGDLDIWISNAPENAMRMVKVMEDFGFSSLGLKSSDFQTPGYVFQMGRPPFRIDILTSADGIDFETCYERRELMRFESMEIPFISLDDLITNKKATSREKDLGDVEALSENENANDANKR